MWRGQLRSEKVTADFFLALECAKGRTPTKGQEQFITSFQFGAFLGTKNKPEILKLLSTWSYFFLNVFMTQSFFTIRKIFYFSLPNLEPFDATTLKIVLFNLNNRAYDQVLKLLLRGVIHTFILKEHSIICPVYSPQVIYPRAQFVIPILLSSFYREANR